MTKQKTKSYKNTKKLYTTLFQIHVLIEKSVLIKNQHILELFKTLFGAYERIHNLTLDYNPVYSILFYLFVWLMETSEDKDSQKDTGVEIFDHF